MPGAMWRFVVLLPPLADAGLMHHLGMPPIVGSKPTPGTFPWPDDYRDPNDAWNVGQKLAFAAIYALFWTCVVLVVHFWPKIRSACFQSAAVADAQCASSPACGAAPGAVPLLDDQAGEVNVGPTPNYPSDKRVIELFEQQAERVPTETALILPSTSSRPGQEISYSKLNAAAVELSEGLHSVGIACGAVVALVMDRSVAQVVAVYGVLKAGAAFLPVDADAPPARKQFLVVESEAMAVVGPRGHEPVQQLAVDVGLPYFSLPTDSLGGAAVHQPRQISGGSRPRSRAGSFHQPLDKRRPEADDMALLIYTSGTTGTPKGIVYDHQHLMHGVHFFGEQCEMSRGSVALLKSPYFWAIFEWEMFPALVRGGKLVVASATGHKKPDYLATTISKHKVDVLMITPQVLDLVLDIHESGAKPLRTVKHIVTVGEPLSCALANRVVSTRGLEGAQLHNFYGASESSCTVYTVPKGGVDLAAFPNKAPAGVPQPHVKVYVMVVDGGEDGAPLRLRPAPTGSSGEICFGGVLAACYWKHEELTLQKWVETEQYGRLYRTGDLGRWTGGVLEVVGRTDRQVKVRGVRVEPEEVEAVLKKFMRPLDGSSIPPDVEEGPGDTPGVQRSVLKEVAVVASREPSELVAFVSKRQQAIELSVEQLRAHCQANLTPAYVPKFFVVVSELPKLPNGKPNLSELKEQATQRVNDEGEMVMDSLGQMKKLSKWAIFENAVIHRCYAYWMVGVLTDHYMHCAAESNDNNQFFAFCTPLARQGVKPWTEILIRSFGNDQDMFGFIMLGAYQDSRPDRPGGKPRVKLGVRDLFIFGVYLCMAMPFPQLLHYVFRSWSWPHHWGTDTDGSDLPAPVNIWGADYMLRNSYTSDHRWYLEMVLETRVYMQIMELVRAPGWLQGTLALAICLLPDSVFEGQEYAFDICENQSAPTYVLYVFSWVFRNWGDGCAMYWRWIQWYFVFYVWAFHYLRPLVARAERYLPKGRTWAAAALGSSMVLGVLMALFHYPNNVLENGTGLQWAALEIGVDILQPSLLVLGMTYLPLDLKWWGNTTLGCYCFHFFFKDQMTTWVLAMTPSLNWDPTGLLVFFMVVGMCILVTTVLGPIGHYFLLSPTILYARVSPLASAYLSARRNRAREAQVRLPPGEQDSCRP